MAPHLTPGEKNIIYKFYAHFKREAEKGSLYRSIDKFAQRVLDVVGICRKSLYNIVKDVEKTFIPEQDLRKSTIASLLIQSSKLKGAPMAFLRHQNFLNFTEFDLAEYANKNPRDLKGKNCDNFMAIDKYWVRSLLNSFNSAG